MKDRLDELARMLWSYNYSWSSEAQLQDGVAQVLDEHCWVHRREVVLSRTDRIDFMIGNAPPGIGVEVKIKGGLSDLIRQLARYAAHAEIGGLLVVSTVLRLTSLPTDLGGKPVTAVYVGGAAL